MVAHQAHGPGRRVMLRIGGFMLIALATAMPALGLPPTAMAVGWLIGLALLLVSFQTPGGTRGRRRH